MLIRTSLLTLAATALLAAPALAAGPAAAPTDPKDYAAAIDNPWLPLKPGTLLVYKGMKDEKKADRQFEVMGKTKVVAGITCVIAEDRVNLNGKPAEKTIGYYAEDNAGNVWYFGEESQELNAKGKVTKTEGWTAGTDGATPLLLMEAHPAVGDGFKHEYTHGATEVLKLAASVEVPYGKFDNALQIKDWNTEESDTLSHKFYLQGVGEVRDVEVKENSEDLQLVEVKTGG